jgi:hypothetical protein
MGVLSRVATGGVESVAPEGLGFATAWTLSEGYCRAAEKEAPTKLWLADLPGGTDLVTLVRLAKIRWWIEQGYQQLKDKLGLDHYEGRSWQGWHHYVTLALLAFGFLALEGLYRKKLLDSPGRCRGYGVSSRECWLGGPEHAPPANGEYRAAIAQIPHNLT